MNRLLVDFLPDGRKRIRVAPVTVRADERYDALADLFGYPPAVPDTCRECVGDREVAIPFAYSDGEQIYRPCPICRGTGEAPPECECACETGSMRTVPMPGGRGPDVCCAQCATTCDCGRDAVAQEIETGQLICDAHIADLEPIC